MQKSDFLVLIRAVEIELAYIAVADYSRRLHYSRLSSVS